MFHIPKVPEFRLIGWIDHPTWVQEVYLIPGITIPVFQVTVGLMERPEKSIVPCDGGDYLKLDIYKDSFMERILPEK